MKSRQKMIKWRLNTLMAEQRKRSMDLATALGISENSVWRLRKRDDMPRLNPQTLDGICRFLDCQPGDLLIWVDTPTDDATTREEVL